MTLVVIRHLPTSWNLAGRLQGRADIEIVPPDTSEQKIIEANRRKLSALGNFDAVFCSTLQRTAQTAAIYGYENPTRDPLLDELDFGQYEGALRRDFLARTGDAWTNAPATLELGEDFFAFEKRVREFLQKNRLLRRILVFGHGGWCRAVKSIHATNDIAGMNRLAIGNNEIFVLEF